MSLREKIAEILCKDTSFHTSHRYTKEKVDQILALLPSLKGWVKVGECSKCKNGYIFGIECAYCTGTGEIRTPLEFEDVDFDEAKVVCGFILIPAVTKSGARIEREK